MSYIKEKFFNFFEKKIKIGKEKAIVVSLLWILFFIQYCVLLIDYIFARTYLTKNLTIEYLPIFNIGAAIFMIFGALLASFAAPRFKKVKYFVLIDLIYS